MTTCFIVRAELVDRSIKEDFDRWYQDEHLPDALEAFGARRAWRGWSDENPGVHYAFYEFDDTAAARAIPGSEALVRLVAEFDRCWGERVVRTRQIVEVKQVIGG